MSNSPESNRSGQERLLFPRSHHLKRKRLIEPLFNRNDPKVYSVAAGSIRMVYRLISESEAGSAASYQIGVAVGRSSGSAVKRNKIKRVILEAVRLNQHLLNELEVRQDLVLTMMIIFRGKAQDLVDAPRDTVKCLEYLNKKSSS